MADDPLFEPAEADDACEYLATLPPERLRARFEKNSLPGNLQDWSAPDVSRAINARPVLK